MALYIKGEKLPKYGYKELRVCPNGTLEFRDKTDVLVRIPNAVIEVKEPHGDLIDRNKVIRKMCWEKCQAKPMACHETAGRCCLEMQAMIFQPAVIKAEEK